VQLKIKIDFAPEEVSKISHQPANFDVLKIRNFLLLLVISSSMICTMAYSMWPTEQSQAFLDPAASVQVNDQSDDNVGILPIIMDDEAPPRQPDIIVNPAIYNDVEMMGLNDPTLSSLMLNDMDDIVDTQQDHNDVADSESVFVNRTQLTLAIAQREPIDNVTTLSLATQKQLFFFTQIVQKKDQIIYHRWMFNNKLMAQIKLNIGSDQWRTYSSKTFNRQMLGHWQVDIVDDNEQVLKSVEFDVTH
jgi:hypothetical protein